MGVNGIRADARLSGMISGLSAVVIILLSVLFVGQMGPVTVSAATTVTGTEYTLADFPVPFVNPNNTGSQTYILIPTSTPHGPSGGANTMDTMGGVSVAYTFGVTSGKAGVSSNIVTSMDSYSYISTYNTSTAQVTMQDTSSNLLVIGGPGVNQVSYYYNQLRDSLGNKLLPVTYEKDANGDYLYVHTSGSMYRIQRDGQGRITADYGLIELYKDNVRYVLLVYGLGGDATEAAAGVLSNYKSWNINGTAEIVKYADANADGFLDTVSLVERVDPPQVSVGIYSDVNCTTAVSSINWGAVEPGGSYNSTIYAKNLGNVGTTLYLSTQNWNPAQAYQYMNLNWNYTGSVLPANQSIPLLLRLTVFTNATGLGSFSFEIVVTGQG